MLTHVAVAEEVDVTGVEVWVVCVAVAILAMKE